MSFKLAGSEAIIAEVGINVNTKITSSGGLMAHYSDNAESMINLYTRYPFTNNASSLYAHTSGALQAAAAKLAGVDIIKHNLTAYQVGEAETMINVMNYQAFKILDLIRDDPQRKFVIDGSTGVS